MYTLLRNAITSAGKVLVMIMAVVLVVDGSAVFASDKESDLAVLSLDQLIDLDVVVTTAGKREECLKDIPASVVVMTRDEIQRYGYASLQEILQNVPGFYMIDDYYWRGAENFGVRGFFSTGQFDNVVILINGVNQVEDITSGYPLSKIPIPVEAIDRIEIVRGPMSVIYGSGAFFGAINIITNDHPDEGNSYHASAGVGSRSTVKGFVRAGSTRDDLSVIVNAAGFGTAGIDASYREMSSYFDELALASALPINTTSHGQLKNQNGYLGVSASLGDLSCEVIHAETQKGVVDAEPPYGPGNRANTKTSVMSLSYFRKLSSVVTFKTSFAYSHYDYNLRYSTPSSDTLLSIESEWTNAYELEGNLYLTPRKDLDMTFGLVRRSVFQYDLTSDYSDWLVRNTLEPGTPANADAVFAQVNYSPVSVLRFVAGLRAERTTRVDGSWTMRSYPADYNQSWTISDVTNAGTTYIPRFAAILQPHKNHAIKLMYGRATKRPSLFISSEMLAENTRLESATIETYEANVLSVLRNNVTLNVSVFQNKLDNLVSRLNDLNLLRSANAGKINTLGLEIGLRTQPLNRLNVDLSACYQKSENKEAGLEYLTPGYAPRLLGYAKLAYELPSNVTVGMTGRYISKIETGWDMTQVAPPDSVNPDGLFDWGRLGEPIDGYAVFDMNLHVDHVVFEGLSANLKVGNLFNQEIRYPTTGSNVWADKGYLGSGRSVAFTLGWEQ